MPQLGETVTEGTITRWLKQVGDQVAAEEPLFEVSTDKVDSEVPSPVAGVLAEIRVNEGETVGVGTILGVHMVGPWVTEQLGQGYLAVNWEATVDEVAQFIQPHPTLSEAFGDTVLDMTGRRLH